MSGDPTFYRAPSALAEALSYLRSKGRDIVLVSDSEEVAQYVVDGTPMTFEQVVALARELGMPWPAWIQS